MNKNHISIIKELKKHAASQGGMRILSQLEFAVKLSKVNEGRFDKQIAFVANYLMQQIKQDGVITDKAAAAAELDLQELAAYAKKYTMICAAHAHIDMNWMWDYSETVAITLETFRTMLNLMEEYPEFTFSQSQASVYKIVEKHDPAMLAEIKKRVAEGRWEVTASTWVEADKNMPNGESHARHLLYTRKYLMDLLDLSPESFEIDYEPDTFGHSLNIPEILSKGGVKYYYQCRGYEGHHIYKWKAPSGASVIVFREPLWYNMDIAPAVALHVPEFCEENGLDSILYVYGVGDHGGGPTRRDLEKLIDMNTWPVYPNIKFGTYIEFFKELEKISDRLPIVEGELNFVFTGCYTTQTRIKTANRIGEAKLDEAESVCALAANFLAESYPAPDFEGSWRKLLFNQFHDILPGSGVVDTREFAMGEFQKILAYANTGMTLAYRNIAMKINTASLLPDGEALDAERSEGGGAGFGLAGFG
ncbi:MAG: alpha-mannosidase, partial [Clostridia bacterium]